MSVSILNDNELNLTEYSSTDIQLPDGSDSWDDFLIGHGAFANVFEVRLIINDISKPAALKRFKYDRVVTRENTRKKQLETLKREAKVISQISHEHIIQMFGVCYDEYFFGLVLELCEGGSLGNVCRSFPRQNVISPRVLASWAFQIANAMSYLASKEFVHRDLKADNVLILQPLCLCNGSEKSTLDWCEYCNNRPLNRLRLKVTDFGLTKHMLSAGNTVVGSLVWLAPEVFQMTSNASSWTQFADVWSFGVLLWELLARELPHSNVYPVQVPNLTKNGQTLKLEDNWPQKWKLIMQKCWELKPTNRPTFERITKYFDDYMKALVEIHPSDLTIKNSLDPPTKKGFRKLRKSKRTETIPLIKRDHDKTWEHSKHWSIFFCALVFLALLGSAFITYSILKLYFSQESLCSHGYSFSTVTGYCYKAHSSKARYKEAWKICTEEGGSLISIKSFAEQNLAIQLFNRSFQAQRDALSETNKFWIGLYFNGFEGRLEWSDGTEFNNNSLLYKNMDLEFGNNIYGFINPKQSEVSYGSTHDKHYFVCEQSANVLFDQISSIHPISSTVSPIPCSHGYTYFSGFCYNIISKKSTFEEATQKCAEQNAHLTSIHSFEEHSAIIKMYKEQLEEEYGQWAYVYLSYLWIGLTYDPKINEWVWSDSTPIDWNNWANDSKAAEENFWAVINLESELPRPTKSDKWITVGNSNYFSFVCKKSSSTDPEISVADINEVNQPERVQINKIGLHKDLCSDGFIYFVETEYCYKISLPVVSHDDAVTFCESDNATLPSIHSAQENEFLKNLYEKTLKYYRENVYSLEESKPVWLGVRFYGFEGIGWDDGSEIDYDNTNIDVQKKRNPHWKTMVSDGSWNPAGDAERASVFCKKRPILFESKTATQPCSPTYSFLNHTNHCYKIGFSPLTFAEATERCAEDGAYLMSIHSQLELDSLIKFYKNSIVFYYGNDPHVIRLFLWLGLTLDSDSWTWSDGSPFDFSNWKSEFNSSTEKRWSAIMVDSHLPATPDDLWKPVGFPNWFGYICKKPLGSKGRLLKLPKMPSLAVPTPELPPTGTNCPDGYELFEKTGYCYKAVVKRFLYYAANFNCVSENASLVSIHSKEENDFLVNLTKKTGEIDVLYTGLGFTDDHWEWTDGSPVDYTNWNTGEPNFLSDTSPGSSETQATLALANRVGNMLNHYQWNNQAKTFANGYVCKVRSF